MPRQDNLIATVLNAGMFSRAIVTSTAPGGQTLKEQWILIDGRQEAEGVYLRYMPASDQKQLNLAFIPAQDTGLGIRAVELL